MVRTLKNNVHQRYRRHRWSCGHRHREQPAIRLVFRL